jgi:outer membrane protein
MFILQRIENSLLEYMIYKKTKKLIFRPARFFLDSKVFWDSVLNAALIYKKIKSFYEVKIAPNLPIIGVKYKYKKRASGIWRAYVKGNYANASRAFEGFVTQYSGDQSFYNHYTILCFDQYIELNDSYNQSNKTDKIISRVIKATEKYDWSLTVVIYLLIKARNFEKAENIIYKKLNQELACKRISWKSLTICLDMLEVTDYELNKFGKKISNDAIVSKTLGLMVSNLMSSKRYSRRFLVALESAISVAHNLSLSDEIDKLAKDYEKNKAVMSEAQRDVKERDIVMKKRDLQRRRNDVQELLNIRRNEELSKLQDLVNIAIKAVGERDGYDLVLYDGIAYTRDSIDITPTVLNYLASEADKRKNLNKP